MFYRNQTLALELWAEERKQTHKTESSTTETFWFIRIYTSSIRRECIKLCVCLPRSGDNEENLENVLRNLLYSV